MSLMRKQNPTSGFKRLLVLPLAALAISAFAVNGMSSENGMTINAADSLFKDKVKQTSETSSSLKKMPVTGKIQCVTTSDESSCQNKDAITSSSAKSTTTTSKSSSATKSGTTTSKSSPAISSSSASCDLKVLSDGKEVSVEQLGKGSSAGTGKTGNSSTSTSSNMKIVIDGTEVTQEQLCKFSSDDIESIEVRKDETTLKQYSAEDKSGVMLIKTK